MRMRIDLYGVFGVGLALLLGCDGEDNRTSGRGTAACHDFQDAVCDFAADECRVVDRAGCDDIFRGVECTSDSAASACANALNAATCGAGAAGCDLRATINGAPAVMRCNQLMDLMCGRAVRCGQFASVETCRMQSTSMVGLDCKDAASVSLRYEECEKLIPDLACTATTPAVCRGVIGVIPNLGM
jgi:hypothetical protein